MTPQIALDLSLDGIEILSRESGGVWLREGVVRLDDPDMAKTMAQMRARCVARKGEDFTSILIIPDSQLLFTSLERDDRDPNTTIRALLRGRTPYEVEDLAFDFIERGDRLQVAVVAIETLIEAEEFAGGFDFRPVALVANPVDKTYPGMPHFGTTGQAADLLNGGHPELDIKHQFKVKPAPPLPEAPKPVAAPVKEETSTPPVAPAPKAPPPAPVAPEVKTPPPPAAPQAPVAPPAAEKAPTLPPVSKPTPKTPEPTFSTRRTAEAPTPAFTAKTTPRISPVAAPVVPSPAGPTPKFDPSAQAPDKAGTTPPAPSTRARPSLAKAASAGAAGLTALSGGLRKRLAKTKAVAAPKPQPVDEEAIALTLPGLKREKAVKPRGGGSLKLGLYLTLSLLALMALVAIWSILSGEDEMAPVAETAPEESAVAILPPADITPADTPIITDAVVADPVVEAGDPDATSDGEDLAALLPDPVMEASAPSVAPLPEADTAPVVQPPLPLDATATPDEAPAATEETELAALSQDLSDPAPVTPAPDDQTVTPETPEAEVPSAPAESTDTEASPEPDTPVVPEGATNVTTETPTSEETTPEETASEEPALVAPTAEGTLAPGGYTVVAGRPEVMPTQRSDRGVTATPDAAQTEDEAILRRIRPVQRPAALEQDAALEEDAEEEVAEVVPGIDTGLRPRQRPAAILAAAQEAAEAAAAAEEEQNAAVEAAAAAAAASLANRDAEEAESGPTSRLALAQSDRPRSRPRSVEREAARIVTSRREQASSVQTAAASTAREAPPAAQSNQTIRSAGGSVARAATERNALRLRQINLIGIYGKPNARRALVRLANGRYVKVEVGDRLDRGRVTAIGDTQLVYQRSGRNVALELPRI